MSRGDGWRSRRLRGSDCCSGAFRTRGPGSRSACFTDALSATTSRIVDGFGETIEEISPARGTLTFWYDGGGNLTRTVEADSVETDFSYDAANRRTSMSSPGAISSTLTYDQTAGENFGIGRFTGPVSLSSPGYVVRYVANGLAYTKGEGLIPLQAPLMNGRYFQDTADQLPWRAQINKFIMRGSSRCGGR